MTICLGALCAQDAGRPCSAAVVASDRMVTLGGLIEFDHSAPKVTRLGLTAVGLIAGDALTGSKLLGDVATSNSGPSDSVGDLASHLARTYAEVRLARAEAALLLPRGLSLQTYYDSHQRLLPQLVGAIDQQLCQFDLGVEVLLVGVDRSGSHLFTVTNPGGRCDTHDVIGYAAIGSGALHALQAMIGFRHATSQDLHRTVFRAYAAKRQAEVAPGVGRETDLLVVDEAGVFRLGHRTLEQLERLFAEYTRSTGRRFDARLETVELDREAIGQE